MVFAMVAAGFVLVTHAQVRPPAGGVLAEPVTNSGGPIYATFEGWGPLKDGTNALLLGYFNRNRTQAVDIPIGPDNSIEPGGPDYGQPTHFLTGRQYGMFAITVPKDFGNKKLTWTINANGHKTAVTFWMMAQNGRSAILRWSTHRRQLRRIPRPCRASLQPRLPLAPTTI